MHMISNVFDIPLLFHHSAEDSLWKDGGNMLKLKNMCQGRN